MKKFFAVIEQEFPEYPRCDLCRYKNFHHEIPHRDYYYCDLLDGGVYGLYESNRSNPSARENCPFHPWNHPKEQE